MISPSGVSVGVVGEPYTAELPARRRIEEVAIARARMARGGGVRAAAQHHLVDHELAVVFAERAGRGAEARIGRIGAARPLPHDPEGIIEETRPGRDFPFGSTRQILAGPARERGGPARICRVKPNGKSRPGRVSSTMPSGSCG